jgi:alkylation response protein AidB-like acyl-CoA dehydrogenase
MAVSVYPLAAEYLNGQRLPGGVEPHEWDGFHDLVVIDEIARCGYLGVIWALACGNSIGAPPLINFGTEEQKRRFVPSILNGKTRFCLGVTEPDGRLLTVDVMSLLRPLANEYIRRSWLRRSRHCYHR